MKKYRWIVVPLNLIFLLLYFNNSVVEKETILKNGKFILLKLAPLDPRSLMQGDYMALRYQIAENSAINPAMKESKRGYCVVELNENNIARRTRLQQNTTPLNKGEFLIKYTSTDRRDINIGAESFFFQEGQAKKYEKAQYGSLKIDENGNSLLFGLYDENLKKIE